MPTKAAGYQVDDPRSSTSAADVVQEGAPKVAGRVTVNLSRRSVDAIKATSSLTDDTKTEIINKAVQLYNEVQEAQNRGGGIWIQSAEGGEPVQVRYY